MVLNPTDFKTGYISILLNWYPNAYDLLRGKTEKNLDT